MSDKNYLIKAEALAFDKRITERVNAGFIPDLRRAVECNYFYKSFWRHPQFIDLYLGKINANYLRLLRKYSKPAASIIDIGCGAGYMSLELARNGYNVRAIDISAECINSAKEVLKSNPFTDNFGSLEYEVQSLGGAKGSYDVVLFSVSLHHMTDLDDALNKASGLLKPNGLLLCYEPCHDMWTKADAAQVSLIRGILSISGLWYEDLFSDKVLDEDVIDNLTEEIHYEYIHEVDKQETEQSPNDNESTGAEMLLALRAKFNQLEFLPGHSFIYRLLGGIRGNIKVISELAEFISAYDRYSVSHGYLNSNGFYFIGRKN